MGMIGRTLGRMTKEGKKYIIYEQENKVMKQMGKRVEDMK